MIKALVLGLMILCFVSSCKEEHHRHPCNNDESNIFILGIADTTGAVKVVVSIPDGYRALLYAPPSDVVWHIFFDSGEIDLGHFEPGIYGFCMVLYADGVYPPDIDNPYSTWDHDGRCDHTGERWCTSIVVPDPYNGITT